MPFEAGEYTKTYIAIRSYITALLDDDTAADQIAGRFKLWAEERCVNPLTLPSYMPINGATSVYSSRNSSVKRVGTNENPSLYTACTDQIR